MVEEKYDLVQWHEASVSQKVKPDDTNHRTYKHNYSRWLYDYYYFIIIIIYYYYYSEKIARYFMWIEMKCQVLFSQEKKYIVCLAF